MAGHLCWEFIHYKEEVSSLPFSLNIQSPDFFLFFFLKLRLFFSWDSGGLHHSMCEEFRGICFLLPPSGLKLRLVALATSSLTLWAVVLRCLRVKRSFSSEHGRDSVFALLSYNRVPPTPSCCAQALSSSVEITDPRVEKLSETTSSLPDFRLETLLSKCSVHE